MEALGKVLGKVLVVDDDPSMRRLIRVHLEAAGLEVEEAACGRSAIESIERSPPDLVCLDLTLPDVSGWKVCEFVRARASLHEIPVLMVSARAMPADRAFAAEVGAADYLVKPFSAAELQRRVWALLAPTTLARVAR